MTAASYGARALAYAQRVVDGREVVGDDIARRIRAGA